MQDGEDDDDTAQQTRAKKREKKDCINLTLAEHFVVKSWIVDQLYRVVHELHIWIKLSIRHM